MTQETEDKIESIIISAVTRLYQKEASCGLELEDFKALEILYKISKEARSAPIALNSVAKPENLMELLRAVKGITSDSGI